MRGMLPLLALIGGALAAPALFAQDAPRPLPAATPTPDVLDLSRSTNRMTVPVSIADRGPFPFIVDTGAERSVVSRELAEYLDLEPGAVVRLFDFAGPADVPTVRLPAMSAGKLRTEAMDAPQLLLADIGAPGMLGVDALQGRKVVLDFEHKKMLVVPARRHAFGDVVLAAESRTGQLILTRAWFEGQPIAVIIDTGSWLSVGNMAMLKLAQKPPKSYGAVSIFAVTGRKFEADYVTVRKVKVGSYTFDHFAMVFADVPPFARFGLADKPALILGLSSLQLFSKVELDFANREVGFTGRRSLDRHDVCRSRVSCWKVSAD